MGFYSLRGFTTSCELIENSLSVHSLVKVGLSFKVRAKYNA